MCGGRSALGERDAGVQRGSGEELCGKKGVRGRGVVWLGFRMLSGSACTRFLWGLGVPLHP